MAAKLLWRELGAPFLDAIFPARCRLCGARADDDLACAEHALPRGASPPRCGRCAARLSDALPDGARCATCRRTPPPFRRVLALGDYREPALREHVLALKHGGRRDLAEPLGGLLAALLAARAGGEPARAVLVPVPLHRWRRLERGYDQAELLARAAGAAAGVPVARALARARRTAPQGSPGAASRAANVRGAFAARSRAAAALAGREAWLVDDVVTSGATAAECARTLKRAGAAAVGVLALARAGEEEP